MAQPTSGEVNWPLGLVGDSRGDAPDVVARLGNPVLSEEDYVGVVRVTRALARLDAYGYEQPCHHLRLPGAGHDVKVPYHPTIERATGELPVRGRPLVLDMGGTPTGYARGDARAWERTLDTLRDGLIEN